MGVKVDTLATEFEKLNDDVIDTVQRATPEQWRATCPEVGWTVAATAHHIGTSHGPVMSMVYAAATGGPMPPITPAMLDQLNAKNAKEFETCTKEECIAALRNGAAEVSKALRGLGDEQLSRTAMLPFGMEMSAEQVAQNVLIGHPRTHLENIRAAM